MGKRVWNGAKIEVSPVKFYIGDQIIARVLARLGTREAIATNPYVIEKVSIIISEVMGEKDIRVEGVKANWNSLEGECTEEQIATLVDLLKGCKKLSEKEIDKWFEVRTVEREKKTKDGKTEVHKESAYDEHYGISINQKTGELSIQELRSWESCNNEDRSTEFKIAKNYGLVETVKSKTIRPDKSIETGSVQNCINKHGIVMGRSWKVHIGENVETIRMIRTLDPILAKAIVANGQEKYYPIDLDTLHDLLGKRLKFTTSRVNVLSCIKMEFDSIEEAKKSSQYKATMAAIEDGWRLDERYKKGIIAVCNRAGIKVGEKGLVLE